MDIEIQKLVGLTVLVCKGQLLQGRESDYLYDVITRECDSDMVLDLAEVSAIDDDGLLVLILGYELLTSACRTLLISNASAEVMQALCHKQLDRLLLNIHSTRTKRALAN